MHENQPQPASRWRTVRRAIGYALGAGLLIACIIIAVRQGDWSALMQSDVRIVLLLLLGVALSVLITGVVFAFVTWAFTPTGPVTFVEMQALIAGSALLNYLPFRPGLLGRAAYLRRRHGISYRKSGLILLVVLGISAAVYVVELAIYLWWPEGLGWSIGHIALFAVTVLVSILLARSTPRRPLGLRRILGGSLPFLVALRMLDVWATAGRLVCAFAVLNHSLPFREAVILATCGMFITLVGITPNGLGLREWLYGAIAASGFFGGDVEGGLQLGLQAALVDRAAEALVIVPTGLGSLWYLKKKMKRAVRPA